MMNFSTDFKLKNYFKQQTTKIETHLSNLVPEKEKPYKLLFQAARYSLLNGGKRIRPILTLATTEMFQVDPQTSLTAACALEMIHTYSMIHDDLPCMDNDDFRRGKPSLHKQFDEGYAVLTGDFLLTHAFEVLSKEPLLSSEKKLKLLTIMAKCSGGDGMIGGQVMDLLSEQQPIDLKTLELLHSKKTGALITTAILFGAIIGNANSVDKQNLFSFGQKIGLAFQVMDDILDVTAYEQKRGSPHSSDVNKQKSTYVSLLGLKKAKATVSSLFQSAQSILKQLPLETSTLETLAYYIVNRAH